MPPNVAPFVLIVNQVDTTDWEDNSITAFGNLAESNGAINKVRREQSPSTGKVEPRELIAIDLPTVLLWQCGGRRLGSSSSSSASFPASSSIDFSIAFWTNY